MLYDANTPTDYLDQLDDDWRRDTLRRLREIILDKAPDLEERIHYKMLGYGIGDDYLFHLNAQRGYVSLYVGDTRKIDPEGELIRGLDTGKGCIRFKKSTAIDDTGIDAFVARAVALWKQGADVAC